VEQIAKEVGNIAFAVAVAWYLLTIVARKLDALADEVRSLRFSVEKFCNYLHELPRTKHE
jgi:hypothetical protein